MRYVDGFVLAVAKKKLPAYRRMARQGARIWRKHGALAYVECVGDDLKVKPGCGVPFPKVARARAGETVVFSWIVYRSRAHRDRVVARVMSDPAIGKMMEGQPMPFDINRMAYGGFKVLVQA